MKNGNSISYLYAADGTKLCTTHIIGNDTTVTDYCDNVIYENGIAKMLSTETGYVSLTDGKYHYYLKDHQGNNRVVADENGKGSYINPATETRYYLDKGGMYRRGFESPHVDVWYNNHPTYEKAKLFLNNTPKMYTPFK